MSNYLDFSHKDTQTVPLVAAQFAVWMLKSKPSDRTDRSRIFPAWTVLALSMLEVDTLTDAKKKQIKDALDLAKDLPTDTFRFTDANELAIANGDKIIIDGKGSLKIWDGAAKGESFAIYDPLRKLTTQTNKVIAQAGYTIAKGQLPATSTATNEITLDLSGSAFAGGAITFVLDGFQNWAIDLAGASSGGGGSGVKVDTTQIDTDIAAVKKIADTATTDITAIKKVNSDQDTAIAAAKKAGDDAAAAAKTANTDIGNLKTDISTLKTDVATLKTENFYLYGGATFTAASALGLRSAVRFNASGQLIPASDNAQDGAAIGMIDQPVAAGAKTKIWATGSSFSDVGLTSVPTGSSIYLGLDGDFSISSAGNSTGRLIQKVGIYDGTNYKFDFTQDRSGYWISSV